MKSGSEWIEREISAWVEESIISEEAAAKIRSRYEKSAAIKSGGVMAGAIFTAFGAVMVSMGVIAIFAYNWDALSRGQRAFLAFLLLFAAQAFALFAKLKRPRNEAFAESSAIFLPIAFAGALAIIAQTYHLGGNLADFAIVAIGFTLPSLFLINSVFAGAIFLLASSALLSGLLNSRHDEVYTYFNISMAWAYFLIWSAWYIYRLAKDRFSYSSRSLNLLFMLAVLAIANSYFSANYLGNLHIYNSIILASFWSASVLLYPNETRAFWKPVEEIAKVIIAITLLAFSFDNFTYSGRELSQLFYILTMLYFALIGYSMRKIAKERLYELIIPISPFLFYAASHAEMDMSLFFSFFSLAGAVMFILGGIKRADLSLANQGTLWLAALILIKFFQSDISFLIKGVAFVIMGTALIIFSRYVHKLIRGAK